MPARQGYVDPTIDEYRHEAFLYRGMDEFAEVAGAFVCEAIEAREPVLLAISSQKHERLRHDLGDVLDEHRDDVQFVDITDLGRNPARIIPAWRRFLNDHHGNGRGARGIGEPVWAGRTDAEMLEAQRHERLLNVAFEGVERFWLMCPYDVTSLGAEVVDEAYRSHPYAFEGGLHRESRTHERGPAMPAHLEDPLPDPVGDVKRVVFAAGELAAVRRLVGSWATASGMPSPRADLVVLAVNELVTNSIEHGGGRGELLMWTEPGFLVVEVRDRGYIAEPLVGRFLPDQQQGGGRGVWLVNQICDLVQIRTTPGHTGVRIHISM